MSKPTYKLTIHKTYYDQGFFNLGVDVNHFVRPDPGVARLKLGDSGATIEVKVNRSANRNGTPRILGGAVLRNWIQRNFEVGEVVDIEIDSPVNFSLKRPNSLPGNIHGKANSDAR